MNVYGSLAGPYGVLVERDIPIIRIGGASIAFIPTVDEVSDADHT